MSERIARSAGLIGLATLTSRVLGLVRDVLQGAFFGTSAAADAFVVATRLPTLLRDLFAEGAMSAAFVPIFTRYLTKDGREAAWRLGSQVINALTIVTGVIVIAAMIYIDPLTRFYAAHYADTPEKLQLTSELARINMPFLVLVTIAGAFMGMLNSLRRFLIPALSPVTFNVVFILCMVILVPILRRNGLEPVMALSAGMLLGGVAQIVIQWPTLHAEGYRHRWILNPRDTGLREMLVLMGPATFGVAAAQVNLLVNTWLATAEDGAASALGYAFRLMYMPIGIFGVSVATAVMPDLARQATRGEHDQMRATVSSGLRLMLMLCIPATVGLMVLAEPIVRLIFERGQFLPGSTALVTGALFFYAPGVLGYSIVKIASPSFYSMQDVRTPVIVSVISILLNLVLNLWLHTQMGFRGLALGTAIAACVNAGLLLILLSRRLGGLDGPRVLRTLGKISIASAVMGLAAWFTDAWLAGLWPGHAFLPQLIRVGATIVVALAVLAVSAHLLRIDEFRVAMGRVLARVRG